VAWAILDTGVYISYWERGLYEEALADRNDFDLLAKELQVSVLRV